MDALSPDAQRLPGRGEDVQPLTAAAEQLLCQMRNAFDDMFATVEEQEQSP